MFELRDATHRSKGQNRCELTVNFSCHEDTSYGVSLRWGRSLKVQDT